MPQIVHKSACKAEGRVWKTGPGGGCFKRKRRYYQVDKAHRAIRKARCNKNGGRPYVKDGKLHCTHHRARFRANAPYHVQNKPAGWVDPDAAPAPARRRVAAAAAPRRNARRAARR